MENLNIQTQASHTLLVGLDTSWVYDEYVVARNFNGVWYTATQYATSGSKLHFRERDELDVKGMLFLFNDSGLEVGADVVEKMSGFLAKSILAHLQAKNKMEIFFKKIG